MFAPGVARAVPQTLHQHVTDQRSDNGNDKIFPGEDVTQIPYQALVVPAGGAFHLTHQKVGIKQENDESDFDYGSPNTILHIAVCSFGLVRPGDYTSLRNKRLPFSLRRSELYRPRE
jgi:hypothetical protein